jgi:hypothetical protein
MKKEIWCVPCTLCSLPFLCHSLRIPTWRWQLLSSVVVLDEAMEHPYVAAVVASPTRRGLLSSISQLIVAYALLLTHQPTTMLMTHPSIYDDGIDC